MNIKPKTYRKFRFAQVLLIAQAKNGRISFFGSSFERPERPSHYSQGQSEASPLDERMYRSKALQGRFKSAMRLQGKINSP
jgi:hypothetical protein